MATVIFQTPSRVILGGNMPGTIVSGEIEGLREGTGPVHCRKEQGHPCIHCGEVIGDWYPQSQEHRYDENKRRCTEI